MTSSAAASRSQRADTTLGATSRAAVVIAENDHAASQAPVACQYWMVPADAATDRRPTADLALQGLLDDGIARVTWDAATPLAALAAELIAPVLEHRSLIPRGTRDARPGTLSSHYGRGAFPWHTDGAHWPATPRLSLMRAVGATNTPTLFLDAREFIQTAELEHILRQGSWCVVGRRVPFYASVVGNDGAVRFNPDVMKPTGRRGTEAHALLVDALASATHQTHSWSTGMAVLVDNHRLLHARPPVPETDRNRQLERILCDAPAGLGC